MIRTQIILLLVSICALCSSAIAQQVEFDVEETIEFGDTEIGYRLDVLLDARAPTRVGVKALLDLRDFQQRLPTLIKEEPVSDGCGSRSDLQKLAVEARDDVISLVGELKTQRYECTRTSESTFERGALTETWRLGFDASATARLEGTCLTLEIVDMVVKPLEEIKDREELAEDLNALRVLLIDFANGFLEKRPLCPQLPPELASLDPIYQSGGPFEVDEGGLGFFIDGSIDVSTKTILSVLGILQREQIIPGPP